jgi:hypothetical protein
MGTTSIATGNNEPQSACDFSILARLCTHATSPTPLILPLNRGKKPMDQGGGDRTPISRIAGLRRITAMLCEGGAVQRVTLEGIIQSFAELCTAHTQPRHFSAVKVCTQRAPRSRPCFPCRDVG